MTLDLSVLEPVLPLGGRAPNAHNTQPWLLAQDGPAIAVGWDPKRALGPSDPSGRDLRLSLGAYIETCLIAAAGAGVAMTYEVGRFVAAPAVYATDFRAADITARRTWRGAWQPGELDADLVLSLQADCRDSAAGLSILDTASVRPLLRRADRWFFADPGIVAELRSWTRLRRNHPRYRYDGLTDAALGLRPVEAIGLRALLHPAAHRAGRRFGLPRALAAGHQGAFAGTGSVLALTAPPDADEVQLGRVLTRLWLRCGRAGLAALPQSHLIDCPATRDELAHLAGAGTGRTVWIARVGKPAVRDPGEVPVSPRLSG